MKYALSIFFLAVISVNAFATDLPTNDYYQVLTVGKLFSTETIYKFDSRNDSDKNDIQRYFDRVLGSTKKDYSDAFTIKDFLRNNLGQSEYAFSDSQFQIILSEINALCGRNQGTSVISSMYLYAENPHGEYEGVIPTSIWEFRLLLRSRGAPDNENKDCKNLSVYQIGSQSKPGDLLIHSESEWPGKVNPKYILSRLASLRDYLKVRLNSTRAGPATVIHAQ